MKRLIVATTILALAFAAVAWGNISIKVSPSSVRAGHAVKVSGSVGTGCGKGDAVTLLSKAFAHTHEFAGVPAIYATARNGGAFSTTTTIPKARKAGKYTITGRCGGGNLGVTAKAEGVDLEPLVLERARDAEMERDLRRRVDGRPDRQRRLLRPRCEHARGQQREGRPIHGRDYRFTPFHACRRCSMRPTSWVITKPITTNVINGTNTSAVRERAP